MADIVIELHDGRKLSFPDGTTQDVIDRVAKQESVLPKPVGREGGVLEDVGAGISGLADGLTFGFSDEIQSGLNAVLPLDRLTRPETASMWDEGSSFKDAYNKNLEMKRARDKYDEQENFGLRMGGQIPGAIAMGIGTGGASTGLRGAGLAVGEGAAYGFGSGEGGVQNRATGAAVGAAGGLAGYGIGRGISRTLAPKTSVAARELMNEGIDQTPGQLMGGVAKTVEDKLTSVPLIGDAITAAQGRSIESFNKAAINRALKHVGRELPDSLRAGRDSIRYAQNAISDSYNNLLPKLTIKQDKVFQKEFRNLTSMVEDSLPDEKVRQFTKIMQRQLGDRFSKNGSMTGESMKKAESELGNLIRKYSKSLDGDQNLLADALREAQSQLRGMVLRSNPSKAIELKSINKAFATMMRPERAASMAKGGIFTPGQLQTSTRVLDNTRRKSGSAAGKAMMQDLADNAREVLPSSVPDSGTVGRALLAGGAGYATTSENETLQKLGMLGLLGSAAYTKPGQRAMQTILTERPDLLRQLGNLPLGVPTGAVGGVLATQ